MLDVLLDFLVMPSAMLPLTQLRLSLLRVKLQVNTIRTTQTMKEPHLNK